MIASVVLVNKIIAKSKIFINYNKNCNKDKNSPGDEIANVNF